MRESAEQTFSCHLTHFVFPSFSLVPSLHYAGQSLSTFETARHLGLSSTFAFHLRPLPRNCLCPPHISTPSLVMHFKIPLLLVPSLVLAIPFPLLDSSTFPRLVDGTLPLDNSTWVGVGEDPTVDEDGIFTDAMRSLRGDRMFDFVGKNVGINLEMIMAGQGDDDEDDDSIEKRSPQAQVLKQRPQAESTPLRNPKFRPIPTRSVVVTPSSSIVAPTTTRSTVALVTPTTTNLPPPAISTPPAPVVPTTSSTPIIVPQSTRIPTTLVIPTPAPSPPVISSTSRSLTSSAAPATPSPLNLGFTRSGFNLDIRHVGQGTCASQLAPFLPSLIPRKLFPAYSVFAVGLGACGTVAQPSDQVVAVSRLLFDTFPGAGPNPNLNPICGQQLLVTYEGVTIRVAVQDRCESCAIWDLDFSTTAFAKIADFDLGRLNGLSVSPSFNLLYRWHMLIVSGGFSGCSSRYRMATTCSLLYFSHGHLSLSTFHHTSSSRLSASSSAALQYDLCDSTADLVAEISSRISAQRASESTRICSNESV